MSSAEDNAELKAGHPPAVKAGGMRVARARQSSTGESKESGGDGETEYSTTPPKSERHNQKMLISGVVTSGDKDFSPVAVKHYHEKPLPAKEKRHVETPHNIQQPR
ncbi:hypothetical protein LSH36_170g04040 [Paralvinella palmiformis]|uniref:Death-associated protein 1 n=1 Tax=Paralvinella palmiformis TaxID=53620 RepID=A0AAD9N7N3_9ANNE|nr:hypothetical protein LSH36_170g04040 [Paralvinella palmiformis]